MEVTDQVLDAILARCERATRGPWVSLVEGRDFTSGSNFIRTGDGERGPDLEVSGATPEDLDFIACARQDVPILVAEVRRLRALLSRPR